MPRLLRFTQRFPISLAVAGLPALHRHRCGECKSLGISSPCQEPVVFAIRHAQSVANVMKERDILEYHKQSWLDDSKWQQGPRTIRTQGRLRDCILSPNGIASTLQAALQIEEENEGVGHILLVVSPLTRTMLTASLLFSRLQASGHHMTIVIEPACAEVINAPHDIVENLGRAPEIAIAEAEKVLRDYGVPDSALSLLDRIGEASRHLDPKWWFRPTAPEHLPEGVLFPHMSERKDMIRDKVKGHLAANGPCCRVYIICHWGVLYTLTGEPDAKNLEKRRLNGFFDAGM